MDEERLMRHVAGLATADEVRLAEQHLLLCRECRHALVERAVERRVSDRRRRLRLALPVSAAAVLVIAVGAALYNAGTPSEPVLRGASGTEGFAAVSPTGSSPIPVGGIEFTWRSAGPDAYYALTLTDAEGAIVWSTEAADTSVSLPDEVELAPGIDYYWFADAFLDGANSATTGVQAFQVR